MASVKPKAPDALPRTLYAEASGMDEKVVGSFEADSDDMHIDAAKLRFINQCHAEGRDANSIKFRLETNSGKD